MRWPAGDEGGVLRLEGGRDELGKEVGLGKGGEGVLGFWVLVGAWG